jgi:hypothetical protein
LKSRKTKTKGEEMNKQDLTNEIKDLCNYIESYYAFDSDGMHNGNYQYERFMNITFNPSIAILRTKGKAEFEVGRPIRFHCRENIEEYLELSTRELLTKIINTLDIELVDECQGVDRLKLKVKK